MASEKKETKRSSVPSPSRQRPLRPCVGIMLLNAVSKIWIGRRVDSKRETYAWQMPQGGIDTDETPLEAARRELYEETGIEHVLLLAESKTWYSYELPKGNSKGRYRGQMQKWFVFRFQGDEAQINVLSPPHKMPEFDLWRWEVPARVQALVVPFKRHVYAQVLREFQYLLPKIEGEEEK